MDATRPVSYDLSDYLGMLRRTGWLALLVAALGVAVAAGYTRHQHREYQSATSVLVQPTGVADTNVVGGRTKGDINLDTEAQLVRSTQVATDAGKLMRVPEAPRDLADRVSVQVPANTSVLTISYTGRSPKEAQAGSHAFAEAYLRNREDSAKTDLNSQVAALDSKLRQLRADLADVNHRLAPLPPEHADRPNLVSQRESLTQQLNTLSTRFNQLTTTTVSGGRIITDAYLPVAPSRPRAMVNLASGGMAGLLVGLGLAVVRERLDRRVRRGVDVPRRADVPLLAALPKRVRPRHDDVFPTYGTAGRIFARLRNEVVAGLGPGQRTVVVTGASRGCAATLVAANLAAAFTRAGNTVALVGACIDNTVGGGVPLSTLLGAAPVPGLTDVLAGRVRLAGAVQRVARYPGLRVLTAGGAASAGGLLQSEAVREAIEALRTQVDYVLIEAPSAATSADAQSLASLADAAILAVELRRTRHGEVVDAAEQLRRVGTPVFGAVTLPPLRPASTPPPPADWSPVFEAVPADTPDPAGNPTKDSSTKDSPTDEPRSDEDKPADDRPNPIRKRATPKAAAKQTAPAGTADESADHEPAAGKPARRAKSATGTGAGAGTKRTARPRTRKPPAEPVTRNPAATEPAPAEPPATEPPTSTPAATGAGPDTPAATQPASGPPAATGAGPSTPAATTPAPGAPAATEPVAAGPVPFARDRNALPADTITIPRLDDAALAGLDAERT